MLAKGRDVFHVEFVERDDAVDRLRSGRETYRIDQVLHWKFFGHEEHFVDEIARPISVSEFFYSQEENAAADGFAATKEFLPFFVGADTEDGERTALWHR